MQKLRVLLPVLVSTLLIAILLRRLDWAPLLTATPQVGTTALVQALLLSIPFVLLKSLKWYWLLRLVAPDASYLLALRSFLWGVGVSLVTPAQLGELARGLACPDNRGDVLSMTLLDNLLDVLVLLFLCTLAVGASSVTLGLVCLGGLAILTLGVWKGWCHFTHWFPRRLACRHWHTIPRCTLLRNALLSTFSFGIMAWQFHLLLSALHPVSWLRSVTALPLMLLGSSLPIFFAGFGGRESLSMLLLQSHAVPWEVAVLASLLLFGVSTLLPGIIGVLVGSVSIQALLRRTLAR